MGITSVEAGYSELNSLPNYSLPQGSSGIVIGVFVNDTLSNQGGLRILDSSQTNNNYTGGVDFLGTQTSPIAPDPITGSGGDGLTYEISTATPEANAGVNYASVNTFQVNGGVVAFILRDPASFDDLTSNALEIGYHGGGTKNQTGVIDEATSMVVNSTDGTTGITSLTRSSNTVTVVLDEDYLGDTLQVGDKIVIDGATDSGFNGVFIIATVTDQSHFTYTQTGSDTSTTGGNVHIHSITFGTLLVDALSARGHDNQTGITSLTRSSNTVTVVLDEDYLGDTLQVGDVITIVNADDPSFDGTFIIDTVTDQSNFTYTQVGSDGATTGGTVFEMLISAGILLADALEITDSAITVADLSAEFNTSITTTASFTFEQIAAILIAWDSLVVAAEHDFSWAALIREVFNVQSDLTTQLLAVVTKEEALVALSTFVFARQELLEDNIYLSDAFALQRSLNVVERLVTRGLVESKLDAQALVALLLVLDDLGDRALFKDADDSLNVVESVLQQMAAVATVDDVAQAVGVTSNTALLAVATSDSFSTGEAQEYQVDLNQEVGELLDMRGLIALGDAVYDAWVLTTESGGSTRYNNYPYNSFADFNGVLHGAADDGIYSLDGLDDDGTAIASTIKTGLVDFGSPNKKGIPEMFIAVDNTGDLIVKTVTSNNLQRTESWHRLIAVGETTDNVRAKFGKGVKSVYWQFEIINLNGDDFSIKSLEFFPVELSRKI